RRGIVLSVDWSHMDCVVVGEAANGEEGLETVLRHQPDLVITDIKMPRMDGIEMIAALREHGCESHFIILTAYGDFQYAQSAIKLGVNDYLLKPFEDEELTAAVAKVQTAAKQHTPDSKEAGLLFRPVSEKGSKSKYVEQAIGYMRENYARDLTVTEAAEFLGLSEGHLSRIFKKETDYTFMSYLTNYRIHMAMELLRDCRLKVYEVAAQVGYTDTAYFSNLFKKLVGVSPSEYQDRCR
ncbi:MAG: response regulator, partial [Angelakisella sp.]